MACHRCGLTRQKSVATTESYQLAKNRAELPSEDLHHTSMEEGLRVKATLPDRSEIYRFVL
eukprot:jgi/Botrbrau1/9750/Bobra.85_1s0001.1